MSKLIPNLRFKSFTDKWTVTLLGELGDFMGGGTPSTSNSNYWGGGIPWISSSDLYEDDIHNINIHRHISDKAINESATKIIPRNSVLLISRVGVGKFAVNKIPLCTSQDFANFIPKNCNHYFIAYTLSARKQLLNNFSQGTSIKGFTISDIKSLKIKIPSLPEQQKIASFLSAVDEKIQHLTRKKELLEQYKKGAMQQLFSGKLRFKDENGKPYPKWQEKRLEYICSFFSGGTPQSTNKKYYSGSIPFIGSGNIYDSEVTTFISEEALKNSSAKLVVKGDLLFALYGANSGEVAISKISGAINQAILCIRTTENTVYLYSLLHYNQERIVSKYLQGGQGNLSAEIIRKLKYKFPSLDEQKKIASFLTALDVKIEAVDTQITHTQTFKKGLLQQMFV